MVFTAAVIGLGKIGQEYDYDDKQNNAILTHANAFKHHSGFHLIAGVDPDPIKRDKFEKKFQQKAYPDIQSLYAKMNPNIIALAVPTNIHYSVFNTLIPYHPYAVICEKPIAHNLHLAKRIISLADDKKITLLINYIRRFEPGILNIKNILQNKMLGEIYQVVAHYSKGILNNGSHMIDLIIYLIGDIDHFKIIKKGRKWQQEDPEPNIYCQIGNIDLYLLAGREEHCTTFSLEIIGTKAVIKYQHGGRLIKLYNVKKDKLFRDYKFLSTKGRVIPNDYYHYQWHVIDNLYKHLTTAAPLLSNGITAFKTLEIINRMIESLKERING
jgi:predicted dehydrogenase